MKKMISILVITITLSAIAQWSSDPNVNNVISTANGNQRVPAIVSDGAGGTIITWEDFRSGTTFDIYAQRINASGVVQWTTDGVAICTASDAQYDPVITSDGANGAIITWYDYRNGSANSDIYAQRINASGAVQWTANGVAICTATNFQNSPQLIGDGANGAIITWEDNRSGIGTSDIYAQRINASGAVQWTPNGVAICTATNLQFAPQLTGDGASGAIITWWDRRSGSITNHDIYAQRINAIGAVQWTANGVAISTATNDQFFPQIIGDGASGAIITWEDLRSGISNRDIYAQRINASGAVQWTPNGVAICTETNDQFRPQLIGDGVDGAIITWGDQRSVTSSSDIYAQRINASGAVQWTANGVAICTATGVQADPKIIGDGASGAIVAWGDDRSALSNYDIYLHRINESAGGGYSKIYAQRINGSGAAQWAANGVAICTAPQFRDALQIIGDGAGGAIGTWTDGRNQASTSNDIYAQRVRSDGSLGGTTSVGDDGSAPMEFSLQQNYPNPFNPSTKIKYTIEASPNPSEGGALGKVTLKVYDVLGNEIATLVNEEKPAGSYEVTFKAGRLASGVYLYRLTSGGLSITKKLLFTK